MRLIKFYETSSINDRSRKRITHFKPKGKCKFYAELTFTCEGRQTRLDMITDHRVDRIKFVAWTQELLTERETSFYAREYAQRLEALLEGKPVNTSPIVGTYTSYIIP